MNLNADVAADEVPEQQRLWGAFDESCALYNSAINWARSAIEF